MRVNFISKPVIFPESRCSSLFAQTPRFDLNQFAPSPLCLTTHNCLDAARPLFRSISVSNTLVISGRPAILIRDQPRDTWSGVQGRHAYITTNLSATRPTTTYLCFKGRPNFPPCVCVSANTHNSAISRAPMFAESSGGFR